MNYLKYTHFIKNKTVQKCALGGLAIFSLLGSIGYLVKTEILPSFEKIKEEKGIDEKNEIDEENEIEEENEIDEKNEIDEEKEY